MPAPSPSISRLAAAAAASRGDRQTPLLAGAESNVPLVAAPVGRKLNAGAATLAGGEGGAGGPCFSPKGP